MVHLVMLLHSALSAGTYLCAKRALGELGPFELALVRFGLSGLLYAALLVRRRPRIPARDLAALAALGVVAVPVNQGLFLTGLARSTPGHAALLYALTPIFVFVLARLGLGERATVAKLAGIALALAGVVVVLAARGALAGARAVAGDLLILGAVVAWAVYAVAGKPYVERYGVVAATGVSVLLGTAAYLPIGLALSNRAAFARLSPGAWAAIAYLVVLTSVVSYLLYYWALRRAEASRVAVWSNLQPVLTALLGWAVYGDRLTLPFVAGGAMVLAGVYLTGRP
jgi:drug/metabolite transporter (DMT)-like permease